MRLPGLFKLLGQRAVVDAERRENPRDEYENHSVVCVGLDQLV